MNRLSKRPGLVALVVGASLLVLGIVLYIGAAVASAIDYNAQEQIEGALTTETPLWIQIWTWASISIGAVGFIMTLVAAVVITSSHARSTHHETQR